jgi:hypothetical protein
MKQQSADTAKVAPRPRAAWCGVVGTLMRAADRAHRPKSSRRRSRSSLRRWTGCARSAPSSRRRPGTRSLRLPGAHADWRNARADAALRTTSARSCITCAWSATRRLSAWTPRSGSGASARRTRKRSCASCWSSAKQVRPAAAAAGHGAHGETCTARRAELIELKDAHEKSREKLREDMARSRKQAMELLQEKDAEIKSLQDRLNVRRAAHPAARALTERCARAVVPAGGRGARGRAVRRCLARQAALVPLAAAEQQRGAGGRGHGGQRADASSGPAAVRRGLGGEGRRRGSGEAPPAHPPPAGALARPRGEHAGAAGV